MSAPEARMELARHRLTRAREALADAELLLGGGSLNGAVSRLYYHAARALLATQGLDSRRHSGVIGMFQQHFVKTGIIPSELAKVLPRSFERRQDGDYADYATLDEAEVPPLRDSVARFVDACEEVLDRPPSR